MGIQFHTSAFVPVVLGFFGLGTGYLIYGPQELFRAPPRGPAVDRATGVWGIWLPGFCQFVTGVYLFAALTWFGSLREPALYMAALAFSAYGIHWFALGWNRYQGNDVRPTGLMAIAFTIISVLGVVVFFSAGAWPVGLLFSGLTAVYVSEFFASFRIGGRRGDESSNPAERVLGFFHVVTGLWLMYLTFATTLDIALGYTLPGG
ncbi:hypothetical protein SAMN05421835_104163 [Amycolatopsis sacchari]|uniref:Uncharacterized protein n=1 Tax=Amycolatopsis sacchari TaxID=115433 RepID=A0A1I3Q3K0_9PSEU|nr:hypothetical protein [Amycolatopsis sacchari]SFJ28279.1 hypothetical protein SAMN05421835_104163 [Amycolatopsis sacchari]